MKIQGLSPKQFFRELYEAISEDNVFNGAAALGFYLTLAIFPAFIALMSAIPYLPIEDVDFSARLCQRNLPRWSRASSRR